MKIIDSHVHFFPDEVFRAIWRWFDEHGWKVKYQEPVEELVRILKSAGVQRYVCFNYAHKPGMASYLNKWTGEFAGKHPECIPFAAIHPGDEDIAGELKRCFSSGFAGVKIHCHVSAIAPDDESMFPIYEAIVDAGKVLEIHAGTGPELEGYSKNISSVSGTDRIAKMMKRFPTMKCIIPHFGVSDYRGLFGLMDEYPTLYTDNTMVLSGFFPEPPDMDYLADAISRHRGRVLYGSDFPNIPYDVRTELDAVMKLPLDREILEGMMHGNAERLFGLKA